MKSLRWEPEKVGGVGLLLSQVFGATTAAVIVAVNSNPVMLPVAATIGGLAGSAAMVAITRMVLEHTDDDDLGSDSE